MFDLPFMISLIFDSVPHPYGVGQAQPPQIPTMQGQATVAHAPPMVSDCSRPSTSAHSILICPFCLPSWPIFFFSFFVLSSFNFNLLYVQYLFEGGKKYLNLSTLFFSFHAALIFHRFILTDQK
jgi:hypothetical protein